MSILLFLVNGIFEMPFDPSILAMFGFHNASFLGCTAEGLLAC